MRSVSIFANDRAADRARREHGDQHVDDLARRGDPTVLGAGQRERSRRCARATAAVDGAVAR